VIPFTGLLSIEGADHSSHVAGGPVNLVVFHTTQLVAKIVAALNQGQ